MQNNVLEKGIDLGEAFGPLQADEPDPRRECQAMDDRRRGCRDQEQRVDFPCNQRIGGLLTANGDKARVGAGAPARFKQLPGQHLCATLLRTDPNAAAKEIAELKRLVGELDDGK